jgi:hypothetical protein
MAEFRDFCAGFGIDEDSAREALAGERDEQSSSLAVPWYVRLVVGVGAWVTAIVACALGIAIIFVGFDMTESEGLALAVLGAGYVGIGLWLLRQSGSRVFLVQLGVAIAAAGVALVAFGVRMESGDLWLALLFSVVLTAVIIVATPNRTLQFLAALLVSVLFSGTLIEQNVPYYLDVIALAGPAGVVLMLRPLQRDLQPTALILLLAFPFFALIGNDELGVLGPQQAGGWFAKALHIGLFLWLVAIHWRHVATAEARSGLSLFAAAAILVSLVLPPGGSAALVIMTLAFVIGSRPLALLGVVLQILYVWRFYYDLDATLLIKSLMLMAVGVVLLVAWWLIVRRSPDGVRV